jgi:hypothetical protein
MMDFANLPVNFATVRIHTGSSIKNGSLVFKWRFKLLKIYLAQLEKIGLEST